MRTRSGFILFSVLVLSSCGREPPTSVPVDSDAQLFLGAYQRVSLPMTPVAMSDSGVVVGNLNNTAVRWLNGTLTVLAPPREPAAYSAVDMANNGHVLGVSNGKMLLWKSATSTPMTIAGNGPVIPAGIAEGDIAVGTILGQPFKWTPSTGFVFLTVSGLVARPTHVNRLGWVAGFGFPIFNGDEKMVRWNPAGQAATLAPVAHGTPPENRPSDIDAAGNILSTSGGTTVFWGVNGTITTVANVPTPTRTTGLSPLGRIVGHTIGASNRPWTLFQGSLLFLPVPTPADDADIPVGVNSCGAIAARRVVGGVVLQDGFLWQRTLTCDQGGVALP